MTSIKSGSPGSNIPVVNDADVNGAETQPKTSAASPAISAKVDKIANIVDDFFVADGKEKDILALLENTPASQRTELVAAMRSRMGDYGSFIEAPATRSILEQARYKLDGDNQKSFESFVSRYDEPAFVQDAYTKLVAPLEKADKIYSGQTYSVVIAARRSLASRGDIGTQPDKNLLEYSQAQTLLSKLENKEVDAHKKGMSELFLRAHLKATPPDAQAPEAEEKAEKLLMRFARMTGGAKLFHSEVQRLIDGTKEIEAMRPDDTKVENRMERALMEELYTNIKANSGMTFSNRGTSLYYLEEYLKSVGSLVE